MIKGVGRRTALVGLGAALIATVSPRPSTAQRRAAPCNPGDHPLPAKFESGDLLWPKRPGAYIPFSSNSTNSIEADRREWTEARNRLLQRLGDRAPGRGVISWSWL